MIIGLVKRYRVGRLIVNCFDHLLLMLVLSEFRPFRRAKLVNLYLIFGANVVCKLAELFGDLTQGSSS